MSKEKRRKYFFLTGISTFAILILSFVAYVLMPRGTPLNLTIVELEFLSEIVEDGDIICRLGDRSWSVHFSNISAEDKRFSHMGVARINNGTITVVHAEGSLGLGTDFVNEVSLEDFVKVARALGVYRINDVEGSLVSDLAAEYIGLPFDWDFDLEDDSKLYCTQLLYAILKRAAPEITLKQIYSREVGKYIIPLEAISNSDYFNEIYYVGRQNRHLD